MWLADLFGSSKNERFFSLLEHQSGLLCEAAATLATYAKTGDAKLADAIASLEAEGDRTLVELTSAIRDTFVTPLDRQDLYNLGEALDDMLDYLDNAAAEFNLFGVVATPEMVSMCGVLVEAAEHVHSAVVAIARDPAAAYTHAHTASDCENRMEGIYRTALAQLFAGDDFRSMLKLREIYRHLSNSADRADLVGKLIGKIVVKQT